MYQFIGESDKPSEQLVTNLNFYASEACVGITASFITTASLTPIPSELVCEEGTNFVLNLLQGFDRITLTMFRYTL